jgi:para-aminobenzoate synthetase component 1
MLTERIHTVHTPESLVETFHDAPGVMLIRGAESAEGCRCALVVARPFITFRSFNRKSELLFDSGGVERDIASRHKSARTFSGDPWRVLNSLFRRYSLNHLHEQRLPCGGAFGYWGYELRASLEPKLRCRPRPASLVPDCYVGFYSSVVAFNEEACEALVISTGLDAEGEVDYGRAQRELEFWKARLATTPLRRAASAPEPGLELRTSLPRQEFIERVRRAQDYIRRGHVYQVNLSQRLSVGTQASAWTVYDGLWQASPAPYAAYLNCGDVSVVSASPELFLRLDGSHVQTRPIKGTRPRGTDQIEDERLSCQLKSSTKEQAELVMITDLLRNDLGKACAYGSVTVPELTRLEKFSHVQHLMSVVEGRLRDGVGHLEALAACFPGGSVTGAPKFRAMEIIDELEPVARGPYTGALGYLGFNRQSQLSIIIRTAICTAGEVSYHVGAGIVADSAPEMEYQETLDKAGGFLAAIGAVTRKTRAVCVPATAPAFGS